MAGFLNITNTDTKPNILQILENNAPKNLTGITVACKIATDPLTTRTAIITDAVNGSATIDLSGLAPGSYRAEMTFTDIEGVQTSELFTINVRAGLQ
jgi:hypothetical protein